MAPLVFWAPGVLSCWAGLLCVPVGGGPPASRPRCELRSARRLEARPGPAAAHGHRSLALMFRCITKFSDTVVMCTRASYPWLVLLFRMWPPT
mgnify:CR=1 FL=1